MLRTIIFKKIAEDPNLDKRIMDTTTLLANDPENIIKTSTYLFNDKTIDEKFETKYLKFFNKGNDVFVWNK